MVRLAEKVHEEAFCLLTITDALYAQKGMIYMLTKTQQIGILDLVDLKGHNIMMTVVG